MLGASLLALTVPEARSQTLLLTGATVHTVSGETFSPGQVLIQNGKIAAVGAVSGKGAELAQAMKARCEVSRQDAGCEQFEVFQSVSDPDKLVLLELWKDQAALDAHAKLQAQRPPLSEGLRLGAGEREDYTYNRTR